MMSRETGGRAFPGLAQNEQKVDINEGMTLRDYFAGQALQGMISSSPVVDRTKVDKTIWAAVAYAFADAMLAKRER